MPSVASTTTAGDQQPARRCPTPSRGRCTTAGAQTRAERAAEVGGALVLAAAVGVGQLGQEAPVAGRLEELGAGDGDVAEPDQRDRDPAEGVVGDQHDQAGQHEERRRRSGRRAATASTEFTPRAAGDLEQHRHHRVGAEQPGQQHPRGVGLLDQPERDHDVEQHLVGAEHAVAEVISDRKPRLRSAPGLTQLAPRGDRRLVVLRRRGRRVMKKALSARIAAVKQRHGADDVVAVEGERQAADQRAEGEADVERRAHERLRLHPLLAREHVERVGAAARSGRPCSTISSTTIIARNGAKPSMNGQTA